MDERLQVWTCCHFTAQLLRDFRKGLESKDATGWRYALRDRQRVPADMSADVDASITGPQKTAVRLFQHLFVIRHTLVARKACQCAATGGSARSGFGMDTRSVLPPASPNQATPSCTASNSTILPPTPLSGNVTTTCADCPGSIIGKQMRLKSLTRVAPSALNK